MIVLFLTSLLTLNVFGSDIPLCNFESGMCGYIDRKNGTVFNWSYDQGGTPSSSTGPNTDHTFNNGLGHYMYIETSPLKKGDNAILVSPEYFDLTRYECLRVYTHMYGTDIGELNVYVETAGEGTKRLANYTGDHGNSWMKRIIPLDIVDNPRAYAKVLFEGVTGVSWKGDIAIDDINFLHRCYNCSKPTIKGGTVSPTTTTIPNDAKYTVSCKSGFTINGIAEMTCTDGSLSITPTCPADCSKPTIKDGTISPTTTTIVSGAKYTVSCKGGFTINGPAEMTCTDGSLSTAPTCPKAPADVPLCNFESGMCGYINRKNGTDFNWSYDQGGTPSSSTGPDADHTFNNRSGHYMYIETSAMTKGDNAILVSEYFNLTRYECLTVYTHMYGTDINELNVYVEIAGKGTKRLAHYTGDHGNSWMKRIIHLYKVDNPRAYAKVLFEGVTGASYRGDIAIDDINFLHQCNCSKPTIKDGTISPTTTIIASGAKYTVSCKGGFTINGEAEMTCTDGSLSTAPTCPKDCSKPTIKDGTVSPTTTTIASGAKYTVSCNSGFTINGIADMTCTAGSLSTAPTCPKDCSKPTIMDGTVSPTTTTIASGAKYTVSCNSGSTINGIADMTCTAGSLSTAPTCPKDFSYQWRLYNLYNAPRNSGILQVRRSDNNTWGTVCDDGFNDVTATVICKWLGFRRALSFSNIVAMRSPIFLRNLHCDSGARDLSECTHDRWGKHDCYHADDVVLTCTDKGYCECDFWKQTCESGICVSRNSANSVSTPAITLLLVILHALLQ